MKKTANKLIAMSAAASMVFSGMSVASASGIGVNEATANGMMSDYVLEAVEQARPTWVRTGCMWSSMSYTQNGDTYTLNASGLASKKKYLEELKSKGVKTIVLLGYGSTASHLDNSDVLKVPDESNQAYWLGWQEYVKTVATELKGLVDVYEVWNEQDWEGFNADADSSSTAEDQTIMNNYAALLKQTYNDVHNIDKETQVATGGFCQGDEYLDEFFTAVNGEKCFDVFAMHLYNHGHYDKIEKYFTDGLDEFEVALDKYGYTGDVYMTENGWYTGTDNKAVTEQQQGAALIRNKVLWDNYLQDNSRNGEYIWYTLIDNGNVSDYSESNYGMFDYRGEAKSAGKASEAFNAFVGDKDFVSLEISADSVYKATYKNEDTGSVTYVLWGNNKTANISDGTVYNMDGTLSGETSTNVSLSNDNPKFINVDAEGTTITRAEYDKERNVIRVFGRVYGNTDDVEIYAGLADADDGETVSAAQDEYGYFDAEISAPSAGEVEVIANWGATVTVTVDGEFAESAAKSSITGATAIYNSKTKQVTVKATLEDCTADENLKVLVADASAEKITKDNIIYIDENKITDTESVTATFALPADTAKGKYNVYLSLTNSDRVGDTIYNDLIEVGSFVYKSENSTVTATASELGYDAGLVEDAVIIIAQYSNDGTLLDVKFSDKGISGTEKSYTTALNSGAATIKAMLWKDGSGMEPICDVAVPQE